MALVLPKVLLTALLRRVLIAEGLDPDDFAKYFAEWKATGADGEFRDYYFGKDAFYDQPKRCGRRVLRHVHLPPGQHEALVKWERDWGRERRKTSDSSLIYAEDAGAGFLLIYLAREPHGHQLARMTTPETAQFMSDLADVAEAFIFSGKVLL